MEAAAQRGLHSGLFSGRAGNSLTSQVLVWSPFLGLRLELGMLKEVDTTLSVATLSTTCLHVLSRFVIFHMESWSSGKIKVKVNLKISLGLNGRIQTP